MADALATAVRDGIRAVRQPEFSRHASLEAIDAAMRDADNAAATAARHVAWLQGLKLRRKCEIATGEWPPAGSDSTEGGERS